MSEHPNESLDQEYPELSSEVKNWAMICHLAALLGFVPPFIGVVLGPLAVWLVKGKEHPFIDENGKESLNFQISILIYSAILLPTVCVFVGFVLLPTVWLADVVLVVMAAMKAGAGESYRYPLCLRLLK